MLFPLKGLHNNNAYLLLLLPNLYLLSYHCYQYYLISAISVILSVLSYNILYDYSNITTSPHTQFRCG